MSARMMKSALVAAAAAGMVTATATAAAQSWDNQRHDGANDYDRSRDYDRDRDRDRYQDARSNDVRTWRGRDGRYYCKRSDGTTGLLVGGVGGAVLGGAIGGNALGTIVGAGAGALLGRKLDKDNHNAHCR